VCAKPPTDNWVKFMSPWVAAVAFPSATAVSAPLSCGVAGMELTSAASASGIAVDAPVATSTTALASPWDGWPLRCSASIEEDTAVIAATISSSVTLSDVSHSSVVSAAVSSKDGPSTAREATEEGGRRVT